MSNEDCSYGRKLSKCSVSNSAIQTLAPGASINNLALSPLVFLLLITPSTNVDWNGLAPPSGLPNQEIRAVNCAALGGPQLFCQHNNGTTGGGTAPAGLYTPNGGQYVVQPGRSLWLTYDQVTDLGARWRVILPSAPVVKTISVTVPALLTGVIGSATVTLTGALASINVNPLIVSPVADVVGGGALLSWRISGSGQAKLYFIGPTTGGAQTFDFAVP